MTITPLAPRKSLRKIKDSVVYYPHQIEGIRHLARFNSFILADEMGLGKTLEALTVAAIDFERGWANRVLVITLATLKGNWDDERVMFTNFTGMVLSGTPKERHDQLERFAGGSYDLLIINYEQVVSHLPELNQLGFDIVILDEAHAIKSHKSKRTKACHGLRIKRKFLLTGSPLLNHVNELWSLLHMVDPHEYPKYWSFVNRYAVFGGFKDKQIVGVKNKQELITRVQTCMLRRLKRDVLDLPEKQHIVIRVDFHPEQERIYKQLKDELVLETGTGTDDVENSLEKFLRLKQICGTTYAIDPALGDHSYKLDRVIEVIQEIITPDGDHYEGEPVVVFTQFRGVLEAFTRRCADANIPTWQLHGDIPQDDRMPAIKEWASSPRKGVLACMLQVAGIGLNMTAANKALFIDKLFVPKLNEQAEDRLHRIGADTTKPVQIYEFVVRKSIEQRVEQILRVKRKLFDEIVEESEWKKALIKAMMEEDEEDVA